MNKNVEKTKKKKKASKKRRERRNSLTTLSKTSINCFGSLEGLNKLFGSLNFGISYERSQSMIEMPTVDEATTDTKDRITNRSKIMITYGDEDDDDDYDNNENDGTLYNTNETEIEEKKDEDETMVKAIEHWDDHDDAEKTEKIQENDQTNVEDKSIVKKISEQ